MGMADIAEVLWVDHLKHNPLNPDWPNRDRFVLSNGHGSMLLYALLNLTGYDLPMAEIRNFRQLGSQTPGHPEVGDTPGVETTTGPLGQGLANAVGMALAEKILAAQFNQVVDGNSYDVVDHRTWVFAGDGCLMEGVSHEAASLAGTLGLGKLTCLYDDNGISIDGSIEGWFTDDTPARFRAYGWHVVTDVDGHDPDSIADAIRQAVSVTDKPSLLCCRTTIGFGAPSKAGTAGSHGSPLGEDEVSGARRELDWPHAPFVIPDDIAEGWDCRTRGADLENSWKQSFAEYEQAFPAQAAELQRRMTGKLPADWSSTMDLHLAEVNGKAETIASRNASGNTIAAIAACLPEIIGGSADLSGSNCTRWPEAKSVSAEAADGNYVLYGVREFGMTAIANGLALHGGLLPFTGTFLTFMEYARNAVRMSALMSIRNIMVYTHDSIGLGEDGPTHQPIEQLCNLRTTPNMSVWRPCDAVETVQAWRHAIEHQGPTALILSRQSLQHQVRDDVQLADMGRGGYILKEPDQPPALIIISTGSEVEIAMQAAVKLDAMSIPTRVVSMPSVDVFEQQTSAYKESVLPKALRKRIAIEAAQPDYWYKYVGFDGAVMGIDRFGASAPIDEVYTDLGLTVERLIETARSL
jgi:transketolase